VRALASVGDGFGAVVRSWGLAVTLLLVNLGTAAVLAVPLAGEIEGALAQSESARRMLYGFDYSWWSAWHDARTGYEGAFGPDILGAGFVYKNVDLLLRGYLPMGLFAPRAADQDSLVDPVTLGLGTLYLLVQVFLAGGVLSVLRAAQGAWTTRGLLHGSGFYFGRFVRITLLALVVVALLFVLNAPLTRFAERQAGEAVSERAAMAWLLGRHALLLALLVATHLVSSYARVITVVEERRSAVMAFFSSLAFCLRHPASVAAQAAVVGLAGLLLLALWTAIDSVWGTTGFKTQIVTLLLAEALMLGRIGLRLALQGSQIALYRRLRDAP
jgi:hypothetical protein